LKQPPTELPVPELSLAMADRAFARAAGSDPIGGNAVRLLRDAAEHFPVWLDAIRDAERSILFESYLFENDAVGREFVDALAERARAGVRVHVVYDWFGSLGARGLWKTLVSAGAQVRGFNPPRLDNPLGWLSRDHRKTVAIDGRIGFVTGLCISARWNGDPGRGMEPWRDTGIEIRGPAVAEIERAFAQVWQACSGEALPSELLTAAASIEAQGDTRLRVIAGAPSATGTYRLDLAIAAFARRHLWLTDAYFVGTSAYVQALAAAARDGVDVRLLVPGASDIPALSPLSRAGYRPLLNAGVRVFEWNGTMLHAKSAVADGFWTRIGSTNLNIASWLGNYELDVAIEDTEFATTMTRQFEADLKRATEIVLTRRNRVRRMDGDERPGGAKRAMSGSAGRAAAGAVSVGSALGAALTGRRVLDAAEAGLLSKMGAAVLALSIVAAIWPHFVAWPAAIFGAWLGVAWLFKAFALRRRKRTPEGSAPDAVARETGDGGAQRQTDIIRSSRP
jgi:cardiolipin synthase A/B